MAAKAFLLWTSLATGGTSSHQRGNFFLIRRLGLKYRLPYALQSFPDCRRIVIMNDEAYSDRGKARNLEPV